MSIDLPRLPEWPPSHEELQVWWQQVVEAIEAHEETQDEILADLQTKTTQILALQQKTLELEQENSERIEEIGEILVSLGYATITAEGALELAEAGLNPDGTVKTDKVLTTSVISGAISQVDAEVQVGTIGPVTTDTETIFLTNTLDTVPAGATGVLAIASFYADDPSDNTLKVRSRLYLNSVEVQKGFLRNDGTSVLIHFDSSPVTGDVYELSYQREGEDFSVSRGQILCLYLKR